MPDEKPVIQSPNPNYSCERVQQQFETNYADWKSWNLLEYLAELRDERGIEILIVNWPVSREPRGDCYNIRYSNAALADYLDWLGEQTEALDLPYLDLHDLLDRREFVDSLHPTARGQAKVAGRLAARLEELLSERVAQGNASSPRGRSR
jgi:hypothetical protein